MQIPSIYFAPVLILLSCYITFVTPLKCVVCNSELNPNCADGSLEQLNAMTQDCQAVNKSMGYIAGVEWKNCKKIITFVDFDVNEQKGGITRVFRRCGYYQTDDEKFACIYRGGLGGRQRVCTCEGENCNSGTSFTSTILTIIAPIAIISLYRYQ